MPWKYYSGRKKIYGKKNKWNIDSNALYYPVNTAQQGDVGFEYWEFVQGGGAYSWFSIVPYSGTPGTRKVKNIKLSMRLNGANKGIYYAVVYVPEGTIPSVPGVTAEGYQPSQYVLAQGLITDLQPVNIQSRLSRNLNCGDRICLVFWTNTAFNGNVPTAGSLGDITIYEQHAICYN